MISKTLVVLAVGISIIVIAMMVLLQLLGVIEIGLERLMIILSVIIVVEVAIMVLMFVLKKMKKKKVSREVVQEVTTQKPTYQIEQPTHTLEIPEEVETIPLETVEYKVPGAIRQILTDEGTKTKVIGIEIRTPPTSMKLGHNIFIVKEKIERVPLKKEPMIKELPKTKEELETVIMGLIKKTKEHKKIGKKPKKVKKTKVKKKHARGKK